MSDGPRMPIELARAAAAALVERWKLHAPACAIVGSVRRGRETVGDLEFIAPAPAIETPKVDPLFDLIEAAMPQDGKLFGGEDPWARNVRGAKRGFYAASLVVNLQLVKDAAPTEVPVQIFRYDVGAETNRGWVELQRTGPDEFGIWFLQEWKRAFGIQNGPASVDGHLVDSYLKRVPVADEEACFRIIRHQFIPPEQRDGFMRVKADARTRAEREQWR